MSIAPDLTCIERRRVELNPDPLGWEAMDFRHAFPVRTLPALPCFTLCLFCVILLSPTAQAQHGGGGGHGGFGGGHFGGGHAGHFGGHSGRSHAIGNRPGGNFHWMKLGFGKHPGGRLPDTSSESPNRWASSLWSFNTPGHALSSHRLPSTMMWSPPRLQTNSGLGLIQPRSGHTVAFSASPRHFHHRRYFRHHPFQGTSGCFFNGISQICYFEPFLPFLGFGEFNYGFDVGFGFGDFGGGATENGGDSAEAAPDDMSEFSQPPSSTNENPPSENSTESSVASEQARLGATQDWDLGNNVYVLVLQNGTTHAVTNYWTADGYLEYVSPDGSRTHVPLNALDLQGTVERNESRGLPFVLRTAPGG